MNKFYLPALLLTAFAFGICTSACAQNNKRNKSIKGKKAASNLDIVYDVVKDVPLNNSFTNGEFLIQRNGFYKLELRNINKFLYTVKVDDRTLSSDNNSESIIRAIFDNNYSSDLVPLSTDNLSPERISSTKPYVDAVLEKNLSANTDSAYMESMSDANDLIRVGLITQASLTIPADRAAALAYKRFQFALKKFKSDVDRLEQTKTYYREMINILKTDNKNLDSLLADRNTLTNTLFGENNILALKLQFLELRKKVDNSFDNILTVYTSIDRSRLSNIGVSDDKIKDMISEVKSVKEKINNHNYFQLFENITNIYNAFNVKNFNVSELVQIPETDHYTTSVKIMPNSLNKFSTYKKELKYNITVEGGYKVDFSTGFFFNFLLSDRKYHYQDAGTQNGIQMATIKKNRNQNDYIPSIGLLVHVYKRTANPMQIGGCFGLSTNDAETIRLHLGGSLFLGSIDRFVINAGVSGGPVNDLDGRFEENKSYAVSDLSSIPPTEKAFKLGAFVGISYNLTGRAGK